MYRLKNTNGRVNALLRAGKDLVKTNLSVSEAQRIIDAGESIESAVPNYPICIDNTWFFEGVEIKEDVTHKKTNKNVGKNDE